jgi:hypothetical protein
MARINGQNKRTHNVIDASLIDASPHLLSLLLNPAFFNVKIRLGVRYVAEILTAR